MADIIWWSQKLLARPLIYSLIYFHMYFHSLTPSPSTIPQSCPTSRALVFHFQLHPLGADSVLTLEDRSLFPVWCLAGSNQCKRIGPSGSCYSCVEVFDKLEFGGGQAPRPFSAIMGANVWPCALQRCSARSQLLWTALSRPGPKSEAY